MFNIKFQNRTICLSATICQWGMVISLLEHRTITEICCLKLKFLSKVIPKFRAEDVVVKF